MKLLVYVFLLLTTGFLFSGCTSSDSSRYYDNDYTYEETEEEPLTSDNWECTEDCSGHEAGYEWAEENGISTTDDCGGNSDSFVEGCQAYANEQNMESYEEDMEKEEDNYYY